MMPSLFLWALGCRCQAPSDGARLVSIDDPLHHWDSAIELVPPVHLPQPIAGRTLVTVQLQLPEGGGVTLEPGPDGRLLPSWPPGTVADRVEYRGAPGATRVVDVRGTRIAADGRRWHHVYRIAENDRRAPLRGATWPAGDPALAESTIDAFLADLRTAPLASAARDPDAYIAAIRKKLDCDACHVPTRPENRRRGEHGLVNRGTDHAGWFTPQTLLSASAPLEFYGAFDPNLADPHVRVSCPEGEPIAPSGKRKHATCPDGSVPTGTLDVAAALDAGDAHAAGYCRTASYLMDHLHDSADPATRDGHPCTPRTP